MSAAKYHVGCMQIYMIKQIHGYIIEPTKVDLMKYGMKHCGLYQH